MSSLQVVSQKLNICVQNKLYVHIYQPLHEVYTVSLLSSCGNILHILSEGFGGIHRSSARALWRLLPRPPYLFSSPDHFLMALKPGGLLCCCQTGHPTSCERQEGALLILQPQTQNLCSRNLQKNLCYCVTSHTVLVRLKQIHRNVD